MEPGFIVSFVLALAMLGLVFTRLKLFSAQHFMNQMALLYGFDYSPSARMDSVSGSLFSFGPTGEITKVISGRRNGRIIRMYYYGTNDANHHGIFYTVCEYSYDYILPHMILTYIPKTTTYVDYIDPTIQDGVTLTLEGDFSKQFKLQVEKNFQLEALEIFTPDVMQRLLDEKEKINLETNNQKLYLFKHVILTKREEMNRFLALGDMLDEALAPHFKETSADTAAMQGVRPA